MNEILQKRIEEAAKKAKIDFLNRFNWSGNQETGFKKGAIWMLDNQWISVEEELPPCNENTKYTGMSERVFVRLNHHGQISYCNLVYLYDKNKWSMYDGHVTHWMRIPELKGGQLPLN